MQSMKRANKYDKSVSQKHVMITRAQRELKWLKTLKPRQRQSLKFNLQSIEKSSLEVLDFHNAKLSFEGLKRPIINGLEVGIRRGQKIGVVGPNGAGKTTLLRLITGEIGLDSGSIDIRPGVQIGYFHQDHRSLDFLLNPVEQVKALRPRMDYGEIRALLGRFQFTKDMVKVPLGKLSGGERARIALLELLLGENNMLLLDEPTNNLDINSIRWLEGILSARKSTMVIISHDRHFLNGVCTHMADLDYGALNVFPGSYDNFMIVATAIQERIRADNAKKEEKIKDLKHFVSRISANASKSRQATSRLKQLDKIELDDIKPSSRVSPYIIFNQSKELFRNVLEVQNVNKSFDGIEVLKDINLMIDTSSRVAIIGQNGIGKTTLLRTLYGELEADSGMIKWSENANIGYYAQDHNADFEKDISVLDWMTQFKNEKDDIQMMRSVLGKMLFGKEDIKKSVKSLSGGEKGRMIFGRLMLQKPNILLMDEPTNHMDMESIEALNLALDNYKGTLIFVSHDREFVSSLSTKVVELKEEGAHYYSGNYEDYLLTQL